MKSTVGMKFMESTIGIKDDSYAIEATAIDIDGGLGCRVWCPYPGDDGVALMLRWVCPTTGAVLLVIVASPVCTASCIAMLDINTGDLVRVEGHAEQLIWPGVLGEIVVMKEPRDIEVIQRAAPGQLSVSGGQHHD